MCLLIEIRFFKYVLCLTLVMLFTSFGETFQFLIRNQSYSILLFIIKVSTKTASCRLFFVLFFCTITINNLGDADDTVIIASDCWLNKLQRMIERYGLFMNISKTMVISMLYYYIYLLCFQCLSIYFFM